jgi:hypothetical protein
VKPAGGFLHIGDMIGEREGEKTDLLDAVLLADVRNVPS